MCDASIAPFLDRDHEVARFGERAGARVDEHAARRDQRRVHLALIRAARADGADVRAVVHRRARQHRLARRGDERDHVGAVGGVVRRIGTASTRSRAATAPAPSASAAACAGVPPPDADLVERPHAQHRLDVAARLHAGAEDASTRASRRARCFVDAAETAAVRASVM